MLWNLDFNGVKILNSGISNHSEEFHDIQIKQNKFFSNNIYVTFVINAKYEYMEYYSESVIILLV